MHSDVKAVRDALVPGVATPVGNDKSSLGLATVATHGDRDYSYKLAAFL